MNYSQKKAQVPRPLPADAVRQANLKSQDKLYKTAWNLVLGPDCDRDDIWDLNDVEIFTFCSIELHLLLILPREHCN
jgi:hypothetical protein